MLGQSSLLASILAQAAGGLRPQDVFATSLYTGSFTDQTITNGINLSGEGGMVWFKSRLYSGAPRLFDTVRGGSNQLVTSTTGAGFDLGSSSGITQFRNNGFTIAGGGSGYNEGSGEIYAAWTFRRAPKFFDVVTYTGDGTSNRAIAHNLGIAPGLVIVKQTNGTGGWCVDHPALGTNGYLVLNSTQAENTSAGVFPSAHTSTTFTVGNDAGVNGSGNTYIAYLFAHDTDASGIVQCGSFTAAGGLATVTLGWRPQFLLVKQRNSSGNWAIYDTARGIPTGSDKSYLAPNTSSAEVGSLNAFDLTSTGFSVTNSYAFPGSASGNEQMIYLAIREPI